MMLDLRVPLFDILLAGRCRWLIKEAYLRLNVIKRWRADDRETYEEDVCLWI